MTMELFTRKVKTDLELRWEIFQNPSVLGSCFCHLYIVDSWETSTCKPCLVVFITALEDNNGTVTLHRIMVSP